MIIRMIMFPIFRYVSRPLILPLLLLLAGGSHAREPQVAEAKSGEPAAPRVTKRRYKVTPDFRNQLAQLVKMEPPHAAVKPLFERAGIKFDRDSVVALTGDSFLYFSGAEEEQAKVAALVAKVNRIPRGR